MAQVNMQHELARINRTDRDIDSLEARIPAEYRHSLSDDIEDFRQQSQGLRERLRRIERVLGQIEQGADGRVS